MGEPDFSYDGVDESEAFIIKDGQSVIDTIEQSVTSGVFDDFEFVAHDESGNDYFLMCCGYSTLNRFGKERLYFVVKSLEEETDKWFAYYVAQRSDGEYLLVHETDDGMFNEFVQKIEALANSAEAAPAGSAKKSGKGRGIALKIILFPFWLLWEFIKALLSLCNIGFGDSSAVQAFKRGYNGESAPLKEYTFINDMGCGQTVYSRDGKEFYSTDGSYVGRSSDGGKTIR